MDRAESVRRLADEIDRLIDYFRDEYDITYAAAVGVLFMKAHLLANEATVADENDDTPHLG